jgi:miniconductance mechanosensitive channel
MDAWLRAMMLIDEIKTWLLSLGVSRGWAVPLADILSLVALVFFAFVINWIAKKVILRVVQKVVQKTTVTWDDVFLETGVFTRLSHVAPALVVTTLGPQFFVRKENLIRALGVGVNVYLIVIVLMVISALLNSVVVIYDRNAATKHVPVKGFIQGAKLVVILFGAILILSVVLDRSPIYFLSGLGALTAVLLLVFRDALLGLVAGIQISVNRMIQVGDWIEMPKYGADGDVIDVSLTTVKVSNWDRTITTVPTYALISDPVKNWRGMQESGGRRIKRSLYIDMNTVRFVDDEILTKMLGFKRLRPYLEEKIPELEAWNKSEGVDPSMPVNARRLTNLGCFRAYVAAYLRANPQIHDSMTFLVRQLQPTDKGLPLEIYVFTNDTRWAVYEGIQSDIFDHLLAVIGEFGLSVFQSPSGRDFQKLAAQPA